MVPASRGRGLGCRRASCSSVDLPARKRRRAGEDCQGSEGVPPGDDTGRLARSPAGGPVICRSSCRLGHVNRSDAWALRLQGWCTAYAGPSPLAPEGATTRRSRADEPGAPPAIPVPSQAWCCVRSSSSSSTHTQTRKLKEGRPPELWWDRSIHASKIASLPHSNGDARQLGAYLWCTGGHSPQPSCGATTHRPRITKSRIGTDRALPYPGRVTETMLPQDCMRACAARRRCHSSLGVVDRALAPLTFTCSATSARSMVV